MKTVVVPASKSLTNRALIVASIAHGKSTIKNYSKSRDSLVLIEALAKLGVKIVKKRGRLTVIGNRGKFKSFTGVINVADAGTAWRFLTALTNFIPGKVTLEGSKRLSQRPIKELSDSMKTLESGKVSIKGDVSSQFISAILMVAAMLKNGLTIEIIGDLVSKSYVDMTIDLMRDFGVRVMNHGYKKFVVKKNQSYEAQDYEIEADASGASYFWAIAAVTGKTIRVKDINPLSNQGDIRFPDLLESMGCRVKRNIENRWIEVEGKSLKGVVVDMELMPDTAQTLAVVAAFAEGKTLITGLKTLKVKETDRLEAMHQELKKIGIKSHITDDSIEITGGHPKAAAIDTYGDHRMAMAFAVAKARIPELSINNPEVVAKSFPDFWQRFEQII